MARTKKQKQMKQKTINLSTIRLCAIDINTFQFIIFFNLIKGFFNLLKIYLSIVILIQRE